MSLKWIRDHYHVPAKRGQKVFYKTRFGTHYGTIASGNHYLSIHLHGCKRPFIVHPTDENLAYLVDENG